jgi:hypothetical protein
MEEGGKPGRSETGKKKSKGNVMIVHTLKQARNSSVLISWLCSMCLSCF